MVEARTFAQQDAQYTRAFTQGSSFDALSEGEQKTLKRRYGEDARDRYESGNGIEDSTSEIWTKVTSEQIGQDLSDLIARRKAQADRTSLLGPWIECLRDCDLPLAMVAGDDQIAD